MERIAFKMKLFPGGAEEYRRRHDATNPDGSPVVEPLTPMFHLD